MSFTPLALSRFGPFSNDPLFGSLARFPDEFSSLFDAPLSSFAKDSRAVASTAVDVKETKEGFHFIADLPGLQPDHVKVQIEEGNVLSIGGERTKEERQDTDTYHRVERRSTGKFLRRFRLPDNADVDKITAKCEHGVLHVTVPKVAPPEPEKPKVIHVEIQ